MGTGFSLLYRRNGVYRFRRFAPKPLREIIGRQYETGHGHGGLGTGDDRRIPFRKFAPN
jgi:hypothetical protein